MGLFSKKEDYSIDNDNFYKDIKSEYNVVETDENGNESKTKLGGSHDHVEGDHRHHTDYVSGVGHNSYDYHSNPANRYDEHYTNHNDD